MLNRIRRLNISLAAKCQLLFGSALVLIIAAALFVPWQRMEQLTDQLNDTAAAAVAENIIRQHVLSAPRPTTLPTTNPDRAPSKIAHASLPESLPSRLISLYPPRVNR